MKIKVKYKDLITFIIGFAPLLIYVSIDNSLNMMMMIPVTILLFTLKFLNRDFNFPNKRIILYSMLIIVIYIASILYNFFIDNNTFSIYTVIRLFYTMSIFLFVIIVTSFKFTKKQLQTIFIFNILSACIISFNIIFLYFNGMLGKISVINIFGAKVEENYTASLLAFLSTLSFQFILNNKKNKFAISSFCIITIGLLLTGCRAAFVSLVFYGVFIFLKQLFFNIRIPLLKKGLYLFITILLGIVILVNLKNILPPFIYQRFFVNSLQDNSNSIRMMVWKYGVDGLLNRPILGYGVGNFVYYLQMIFPGSNTVVAHNTFLDIALDIGILGFIILGFFIFQHIYLSLVKDKNLLGVLFVLLFTAFIVGGERTYFFWNGITTLILISEYYKHAKNSNVFKLDYI